MFYVPKIVKYRWKFCKRFTLQWVLKKTNPDLVMKDVQIDDMANVIKGSFWDYAAKNYRQWIINKFKYYFSDISYNIWWGQDRDVPKEIVSKNKSRDSSVGGFLTDHIFLQNVREHDESAHIVLWHQHDDVEENAPSIDALEVPYIKKVKLRKGLTVKRVIYARCKKPQFIYNKLSNEFWGTEKNTLYSCLAAQKAHDTSAPFYKQFFGPSIDNKFQTTSDSNPVVVEISFMASFYVYATFSGRVAQQFR